MKIVVTGGGGVLGRAVTEHARAAGHFVSAPTHEQVDILNPGVVGELLDAADPDYVINCAGVIPHRQRSDVYMAQVNAVGPHVLAAALGGAGTLLNVSTDCVYDGIASGRYLHAVRDVAPTTLYGRTKLAGEPEAALNIRTSFASPGEGFWGMYQDATDRIEGWTEAWWSGSTVWAVAEALVDLCERGYPRGVLNLATAAPITKFGALVELATHLGRQIDIRPTGRPQVLRAMYPDIELPSFAAALAVRREW